MTRILLFATFTAFLAVGLAACGKAGAPQVPSGQKDTLLQKYPPPEGNDRYPTSGESGSMIPLPSPSANPYQNQMQQPDNGTLPPP